MARVTIGDVEFVVGGLSVADLRRLCLDGCHDALAAMYEGASDDLIDDLPDALAKVIARAMGRDKAWAEVAAAPAGVQLDLLDAIWRETFATERPTKADQPRPQTSRRPADAPATFKEWLWSLRRQVSLLKAAGHVDADSYRIGDLMDEAAIVVERDAAQLAGAAHLAQAVLATVPNQSVKPATTKKAHGHLTRLLQMMAGAADGQQ